MIAVPEFTQTHVCRYNLAVLPRDIRGMTIAQLVQLRRRKHVSNPFIKSVLTTDIPVIRLFKSDENC